MNDRSTSGGSGTGSVPDGGWPIRSGRMPPIITDFSTVRAETGYGLDAGPELTSHPVGPGLTVLTGASGFGKTHLAAAFITRLARAGATDAQVWINASSKWAVMASYARAACDLGVSHQEAKIDAG